MEPRVGEDGLEQGDALFQPILKQRREIVSGNRGVLIPKNRTESFNLHHLSPRKGPGRTR